MITRQDSSNAAQTADATKGIDLGQLVEQLDADSSTVQRETHENVALNAKGVTSGHHQRGERLIQSFVNGLKNIGKCKKAFVVIIVNHLVSSD